MLSYCIPLPVRVSKIHTSFGVSLVYTPTSVFRYSENLFLERHVLLNSISKLLATVTLRSTSLAVKLFASGSYLFVDFGFSHFSLIVIPSWVRIFCSKKSIRFFSSSLNFLNTYTSVLFRLKKFSVYKSKGLYWSSRRQYVIPKIGKKQQV